MVPIKLRLEIQTKTSTDLTYRPQDKKLTEDTDKHNTDAVKNNESSQDTFEIIQDTSKIMNNTISSGMQLLDLRQIEALSNQID